MPSHIGLISRLRRFIAVVGPAVIVTVAVLLTAGTALAQAEKKEPAEKKSKNYSIPWVVTVLCLAGLVVPVAMATQRKWEMPFEDDEEK